MMASTGCDGVVVGRGCLGRPWLFRDLAAAFRAEPVPDPPGLGEVCSMMLVHLDLLCGLFGQDLGTRQFRKHTGWYLTGFPVGSAVRRDLALASTVAEVNALGLKGLTPRQAITLRKALFKIIDPYFQLTLPDGATNAAAALADATLRPRTR